MTRKENSVFKIINNNNNTERDEYNINIIIFYIERLKCD